MKGEAPERKGLEMEEKEFGERLPCSQELKEYAVVHRFEKDRIMAEGEGILPWLEEKADQYQGVAEAYLAYIQARTTAAGREEPLQKEQDHYWTLSNIPGTLRKAAREQDPEEIQLLFEALEEANLDVAHLVRLKR